MLRAILNKKLEIYHFTILILFLFVGKNNMKSIHHENIKCVFTVWIPDKTFKNINNFYITFDKYTTF